MQFRPQSGKSTIQDSTGWKKFLIDWLMTMQLPVGSFLVWRSRFGAAQQDPDDVLSVDCIACANHARRTFKTLLEDGRRRLAPTTDSPPDSYTAFSVYLIEAKLPLQFLRQQTEARGIHKASLTHELVPLDENPEADNDYALVRDFLVSYLSLPFAVPNGRLQKSRFA